MLLFVLVLKLNVDNVSDEFGFHSFHLLDPPVFNLNGFSCFLATGHQQSVHDIVEGVPLRAIHRTLKFFYEDVEGQLWVEVVDKVGL